MKKRTLTRRTHKKTPLWSIIKDRHYSFRKRAHRQWPSVFADPDYAKRLAIWRRHDKEENNQSTPPEDEVIDLRCVWAVEFYTASHLEALVDGLDRLGWDKDEALRDQNAVRWVQRWREVMHAGGWFNLGHIVKPGEETGLLGGYRTAPLAPDIAYAVGKLYSLSSSVTCVVMGFVLSDEMSTIFDRALRKDRETYSERYERFERIWGPPNQKQAEIRSVRAKLRDIAGNWFRNHLPGLFSSESLGGEFPTCEFITLKQGVPFPKIGTELRPGEYLRLLEMDHDFDVWESKDIPGLKFGWGLTVSRGDRFHAVVAARESEFDQKILALYGGERSAYVSVVDEEINRLLSRWALLAVFSAFERHLGAVRDSMAKAHRQKPLRLLKTLGDFVSRGADIASLSAELERVAKHKGAFLHEVGIFRPSYPKRFRDENVVLAEELREHISQRAASLEQAERGLRDLMVQQGTLRSAQQMGRLTWLLVALTVALLLLTVALAKNDLSGFLSWLRAVL